MIDWLVDAFDPKGFPGFAMNSYIRTICPRNIAGAPLVNLFEGFSAAEATDVCDAVYRAK